ncbi:hypothetical protein [Winogradskyella sp.]|uniref:hypothetical protein n=1 Tax=Winogradskyella sp. TaxID=1883156 RepID=UPI003BAD3A48
MNFKKLSHLVLFTLFFLNFQCFDDDGNTVLPTNCAALAIIDSTTFQTGATSPYTINSVSIIGDCMSISISATGCDGMSWVMQLIDSGDVQESDPPQRSIKLFLVNNEACLAQISKAQTFDLSTLRVDGVNEIILNLDGYDDPITYSY